MRRVSRQPARGAEPVPSGPASTSGPVAVCVVVLSCAAAATFLAGCSNAGPASSGTRAALEASATQNSDAALAEAIRSGMRRASIPGAIVGVWREGRPPYVRAFGVRDTASGEPMATDLSMRIGSNTKAFVVTAILMLADQGRLGLDDPIDRYVKGRAER